MMMNNIDKYVFDTSSILEYENKLFTEEGRILVPSIVLEELDGLKTKNPIARRIIKKLRDNEDKYEILFFTKDMIKELHFSETELTNDIKILACAVWANHYIYPDEIVFVTNDYTLQVLSRYYFGEEQTEYIEIEEDEYYGVEEVGLNEPAVALLYENPSANPLELLVNQYVIITDIETGEYIDTFCWTGKEMRPLKWAPFTSKMFGTVKPKQKDYIQACAFDSVTHNKITMLKGPSGSGKSTIALSYLIAQLEKGVIDRIIIFCNTVATMNSAKLGYYPGDKNTKLLDSQIGNFLYSKLGEYMTKQLIDQEKLILLPMSDIRGYDTGGMRAGIYITEAQNMDIALMKLALQRVGDDSIVILDGDVETQLDAPAFGGRNNGMNRVSKVFRGSELYGEVNLKTIHRSQIALLAQQM